MAQLFGCRLAAPDRRARLHRVQRDAVHRRPRVPREAHRADARRLGKAPAVLPRGGQEGRPRRRRGHPVVADFARTGLHRPRQRSDRRPADRQAVPPGDHAHRRLGHDRERPQGDRPRARPRGARNLHQVPQDAQRGRLRHVHAGDPGLPALAHHHRPAGRLRARAHHRRLSARRAVRRRPPDRGEEGRARRDRRALAVGRSDAAARGDGRPAPRARRPQDDGGVVRLRHRQAGGERPRGRAVDLLRLPRRDQGDERRRDVGGPHLDLPRHLHRARSRREDADRSRSAGAHRPARDQAAHRPLHAHARIRRALLGRPVLGDGVHRRHGAGRTHARHALELPHAADPHEPRAGARAQPDGALVEESAGALQAPLHRHEPRHRRRCNTRTTT